MQPTVCEFLWGLGTLLINKEESLEEEAFITKAFFPFWPDREGVAAFNWGSALKQCPSVLCICSAELLKLVLKSLKMEGKKNCLRRADSEGKFHKMFHKMLIILFAASLCNLNYKHWKRWANELPGNGELDVAQRGVTAVFSGIILTSLWLAKSIEAGVKQGCKKEQLVLRAKGKWMLSTWPVLCLIRMDKAVQQAWVGIMKEFQRLSVLELLTELEVNRHNCPSHSGLISANS